MAPDSWKFQLAFRSWIEMMFIVSLLPTLIQRYCKNYFIFDPVQKRETNWNLNGSQMPHFMIVLLYINSLNLSWIKKKCLFLRNMEPLRPSSYSICFCWPFVGGSFETSVFCFFLLYLFFFFFFFFVYRLLGFCRCCLVNVCSSPSRKHAYIIQSPLNPTFI